MADFKLGIQLYTVRELCKTDFTGTLSALAKMGYQGVEFAGQYGGMSPDALAAFLGDLGLACCGLHGPLVQMCDPDSQFYACAAAVHSPYVTTSCLQEVAKDWPGAIAKVAEAARVAQKHGLQFTYHNHAQEFQKFDGVYALDMLYQRTDAAQVQAELDTYWIKAGGEDPAAYIRKYPGRVPQVHLKDMDKQDRSWTEIGNGSIDLPAVFAAAEEVGAGWIIYEQDVCKRPALESAQISIENLRKSGLME